MIIWDFPFDFLPTTSVGLFRDYPPVARICKPFCPIRLGFSPAQGGVSLPFLVPMPFFSRM
jgi:hypothetical protein